MLAAQHVGRQVFPAVEPEVVEFDLDLGVGEEGDRPADVVGVDVGEDEEVEAPLVLGKRCDLLLDFRVGRSSAAVDQHPRGLRSIAVLDPQTVTVAGGEEFEGEHHSSSCSSLPSGWTCSA